MKQLIQNFKTGDLYVDEVPMPSISNGMVLIENDFSLISAGTERSTVKVAQASIIGKARQRPDLVAQVLQNIRKEGLSATLSKVRNKLDSLKALGYSSSGTVIASLDKNGIFKPGDRVACSGQDYASHAGVVAVPQNLVVKIPENVSSEEAAFVALGSIAMQGVRQADPHLGEKICVIGLGLLGQITCQLLKANGCDVFGVDLNPGLVKLASESVNVRSVNRNDPNIISAVNNFTDGHGFDSVIITAAAHSNDPIEFSSEIARKKGRIVVVGAVKMDIPRDPHFYRKELDLRMSCSYGPGRYDTEYEESGNDYPYPYVRWTEKRNMEAFLKLLSNRVIQIKPLITQIFDIADAEKAYDIVLGKTKEHHIGILLKYSGDKDKHHTLIRVNRTGSVNKVSAGFIGAGSFAQSYLIPNVAAFGGSLTGVATSRGITSKNVADKFKFNYCSTEADDILKDTNINTVFIATPHSSHSNLVVRALEAGKNVYVEKPLAIDIDQLNSVIKAKAEYPQQLMMVGFNRRFAPVSLAIRQEFKNISEPMVINIRVNAGLIPKEHWIQNPEIGGGRIIGEMCHFIDLMQYFADSEPVKVFAESIAVNNSRITPDDNIAIIVKFRNGSVGNLTYLANGDNSMPKEKIEVFSGGSIGVINDFKDGLFHRNGKSTSLKSSGKGHREEIRAFMNALANADQIPISYRSIYLTTLTTFKIIDSLKTGLPQEINLDA
jgi:predicted dehydrogenase/threonine dehydrogenase-like Zn-dependent dehydrogenase